MRNNYRTNLLNSKYVKNSCAEDRLLSYVPVSYANEPEKLIS